MQKKKETTAESEDMILQAACSPDHAHDQKIKIKITQYSASGASV